MPSLCSFSTVVCIMSAQHLSSRWIHPDGHRREAVHTTDWRSINCIGKTDDSLAPWFVWRDMRPLARRIGTASFLLSRYREHTKLALMAFWAPKRQLRFKSYYYLNQHVELRSGSSQVLRFHTNTRAGSWAHLLAEFPGLRLAQSPLCERVEVAGLTIFLRGLKYCILFVCLEFISFLFWRQVAWCWNGTHFSNEMNSAFKSRCSDDRCRSSAIVCSVLGFVR